MRTDGPCLRVPVCWFEIGMCGKSRRQLKGPRKFIYPPAGYLPRLCLENTIEDSATRPFESTGAE
jgi:hypothetical protein